MYTQARGEDGGGEGSKRRTLALVVLYGLLLTMECRTLPGILRARPPAPGLLSSADLVLVYSVLQAVLLLSFCLRVLRISRGFLVTVCAVNPSAHPRDRRS